MSDRRGSRPEPQADALEAAIKARQADFDGLTLAIGKTLEEKVDFVEKHRRRLREEADRDVEAAHERLAAAIEEVAEARDQLVDSRDMAVWAGVYPNGNTGVSPQTNLLAGGIVRAKRPQECAYGVLGLVSQLRIDRVLDALRIDAAWLRTAATPEQRALLEGRDSRRSPATEWTDSEDHRDGRRAEIERAIEAFKVE
jgi:hypothetical protein